jgi:hypothetical protein
MEIHRMDTRAILALLLLALLAGCGAAAAGRAPAIITTATPAPPSSAAPLSATALPAATATPVALGITPAGPAAPREGAVGELLVLELGEELSIAAAGLTLRFEGVPEDSRCPADAQCIWAGRVVVTVEARAGAGVPETLTLGLPGGITPDAPERQAVGAHTVQLVSLDPYPATSGGLPLPYVATLLVERR